MLRTGQHLAEVVVVDLGALLPVNDYGLAVHIFSLVVHPAANIGISRYNKAAIILAVMFAMNSATTIMVAIVIAMLVLHNNSDYYKI